MNFLQAHAALRGLQGGRPLRFTLACSAVTVTLDLYLRAHAAQAGFKAQVCTLPFDTLAQRIRSEPAVEEPVVFLLLPWDFLPQLNWRTGVVSRAPSSQEIDRTLEEQAKLFACYKSAQFLYLPAPIPPASTTLERARAIGASIRSAALLLGADELPAHSFSLTSYLETGNAFSSRALGEVAAAVIRMAMTQRRVESKKVLVTDLDNTLWHGVIGEDGIEGIACGPEGLGFRFFVYQSFLRKLRNEGVVLAAVSRNDEQLALAPFRTGTMLLKETDFVSIIATYHSKSAQIRQLAERLNLGLNSFVFVDDNPIELEEVQRALPQVEPVRMEDSSEHLPDLLDRLTKLFGKESISEEDTRRTEMYRLRGISTAPNDSHGADLRDFLASLQMTLTVRRRVIGDHTRCLQLINKTNQFNINGRRLSEEEMRSTLEDGGHLYGVSLDDRNGSHGEVIACLIDREGTIRSWVMSCRTFQRRAEYAFTAWLAAQPCAPDSIDFLATERNEPSQMFLREICGELQCGRLQFKAEQLARRYADELSLFRLMES